MSRPSKSPQSESGTEVPETRSATMPAYLESGGEESGRAKDPSNQNVKASEAISASAKRERFAEASQSQNAVEIQKAASPKRFLDGGSPRIYVIVVTYNGLQWLDKCIGTLYSSEIKLNIVVIDNASSDGTPDVIRDKWPLVTLIEAGRNLGFGQANNIGIRYAMHKGFDCVYLLNQDAWISPDQITELAELQRADTLFGVLSPMQMQSDLRTPDQNFDRCLNELNRVGYRDHVSSHKTTKVIYEVRKVMAAHWLVSAEAIRRVGGFAPIFTHYGEDYNFLDRLSYHGLKAGVCPGVAAVHDRAIRNEENLSRAISRTFNSVFLPLACDINRPYPSAFWHALRAILKESMRQMVKFKSLRPLKNPGRGILMIGRIAGVRRHTKHTGVYL